MLLLRAIAASTFVTAWLRVYDHAKRAYCARTRRNEPDRFAIVKVFTCSRLHNAGKSACIDILRFLVYIHGSIHTIHIVIHRKSRLLARFFLVFHTFRFEYGGWGVERNCKKEDGITHSLCKYGVIVTDRICKFYCQNYAVTSNFY
jgi:hypothetical protein